MWPGTGVSFPTVCPAVSFNSLVPIRTLTLRGNTGEYGWQVMSMDSLGGVCEVIGSQSIESKNKSVGKAGPSCNPGRFVSPGLVLLQRTLEPKQRPVTSKAWSSSAMAMMSRLFQRGHWSRFWRGNLDRCCDLSAWRNHVASHTRLLDGLRQNTGVAFPYRN
jgi:hypothetical protein